jgi:cytochrome c5
MLISMLIIIIVATLALAACSSKKTTPTQAPAPTSPAKTQPTTAPAQTADGKTLLEQRCTKCHSLDRVTSAHKTSDEWKTTVTRMVGKGAELTTDEQTALIEYLAKAYGP